MLSEKVRTFSDDIQMKFGLNKCAMAHFVNGKLSGHNTGVKVGKTETIKGLEPGQVYKYLGVDESNGIQHSTMRERLRREYFRRVKMDRVVWSEQGSSHQRVGTTASHVQSFTGGPRVRTCSSLMGEPGSSSPCTVFTILRQTWTDCMLLAVK